MTDLDVLVPVWGRAELLAPLVASLDETTPVDWRIWFLCSRDDPAGLDGDAAVRAVLGPYANDDRVEGVLVAWPGGTPGDYARKINLGYRLSRSPLLFLGATDILFRPGWYDAASRLLSDTVQVVGTSDGSNPRTISGRHSTHTLVARRYVDEQGTIDEPFRVLHEGYWHEFVDDEFVATARYRQVWAHAPDALVEHMHPNWQKRTADASDAGQAERLAAGRRVFDQRSNLWGVRGRRRRGQPIPQRVSTRRPRVVRRVADPVPAPVPAEFDVTVIVATYGDVAWARLAEARAAPSALAQTDRVVVHHGGANLAEARNVAARPIESGWLCFLDADDEIEPGYLAAMHAATVEEGYRETRRIPVRPDDLFVPAVRYIDVDRRAHPARMLGDDRPLIEINRAVIGTLIHSTLFRYLGGFDDWPIYEDWDLWLRAERAGARLVDVPGAVYRAYRRPASRNSGPDQAEVYRAIRERELAARETARP